MELNLADLFECVADHVPDAEAIVVGSRRLTYAELESRANRLAHRLTSGGIGSGDTVGLQLLNGSEYLEGMLACFKIGAIPINVNYRYVDSELRYLYNDAGLVGLVYHRAFAPAVAAARSALVDQRVVLEVDDDSAPGSPSGVEDYESALSGSSDARDHGPRSADDVYCVYTGGTTGMPKGVLWRHEDIFFAAMGGGDPLQLGNVITRPEEIRDRVLQPGLVALPVPPFMHASGHWLAFSTLFGGGKIVIPSHGRFDPLATWQLVGAEHVNILVIVGDAMAKPLLDAFEKVGDGLDRSSLMAIGSGGAILSPSTKERMATLLPGVMVVDAYGSSETGQLGGKTSTADPYGRPCLQVDERTKVFDDQLVEVVPGSGAVGLLARGGRVPFGYRGDPEKSAATFVEVTGTRWALPGDLASVEDDGTIVVLGRSSTSINTGGEKVYPDEVEAALKSNPEIADVVVVGVPDDRWGERVTAVVALGGSGALDLERLRAHAAPLLASYKLPRQLVLVDAVERSPSGKPDYVWARDQALEGQDEPRR